MDRQNLIRQPAVAGTFYPRERYELQEMVLEMLSHADSEQVHGRIIAIISPHAGYFYSGRIAASAYKQIQAAHYDNVLVIAPSHFDYFEGCSIYCGKYQTPIGMVSTNIDIAESIVSRSRAITNSSRGHFEEHSLEVQIPFLQICLGDFKLIPVVLGNQDYLTAEELSNAVYSVLSEPGFRSQSTLIVGSSDLSHYHPAVIAEKMDSTLIKDMEDFDAKRLFDDIKSGRSEACGYGAIISTMLIAKRLGASAVKVLAHGNSGETTHDYRSVVGYLSSIFYN